MTTLVLDTSGSTRDGNIRPLMWAGVEPWLAKHGGNSTVLQSDSVDTVDVTTYEAFKGAIGGTPSLPAIKRRTKGAPFHLFTDELDPQLIETLPHGCTVYEFKPRGTQAISALPFDKIKPFVVHRTGKGEMKRIPVHPDSMIEEFVENCVNIPKDIMPNTDDATVTVNQIFTSDTVAAAEVTVKTDHMTVKGEGHAKRNLSGCDEPDQRVGAHLALGRALVNAGKQLIADAEGRVNLADLKRRAEKRTADVAKAEHRRQQKEAERRNKALTDNEKLRHELADTRKKLALAQNKAKKAVTPPADTPKSKPRKSTAKQLPTKLTTTRKRS